MRHRILDKKLGRSKSHREAMIAAMVGNLIAQKSIRTTLPKAKAARRLAERMVTVARRAEADGTPARKLAARRLALQHLRRNQVVSQLFAEIAPQFNGRQGGYTRITKLKRRISDGSEIALLEWVGIARPRKEAAEEAGSKEKK